MTSDNTALASIIRDMAQSIRTNPGQFTIEMAVIGTKISGTGHKFSATFDGTYSGSGNSYIGNQFGGANLDKVDFSVTDAAKAEYAPETARVLDMVADQLELPQPDKSFIQKALANLADKAVPAVLIATVNSLVTLALGAS